MVCAWSRPAQWYMPSSCSDRRGRRLPAAKRGVVVQGRKAAMPPPWSQWRGEDGQVDGGEVDAQHAAFLARSSLPMSKRMCVPVSMNNDSPCWASWALARGVLHQHGYGHMPPRAAVRSQIALMATAAGLSLCAKLPLIEIGDDRLSYGMVPKEGICSSAA